MVGPAADSILIRTCSRRRNPGYYGAADVLVPPETAEEGCWVMKRLLAISLLLLASCATEEAYRAEVASWLGKPETALVSAWGAPDLVYDTESGQRVLTYKSRMQFTTTTAPYVGVTDHGGVVYAPGSPILRDLQCTTNFTIDGGVVVDWSFRGNDCRI